MDRELPHYLPRYSGIPHARGDGPCRHKPRRSPRRIPHARGDGPPKRKATRKPKAYSPRTWGWTVNVHLPARVGDVFPTHVGMDRRRSRCNRPHSRIPHARGDGPVVGGPGAPAEQYSPRTWGWTAEATREALAMLVFPTHVGMDRRVAVMFARVCGIPHARGDGPRLRRHGAAGFVYSPRTWGWTALAALVERRCAVFPTHVGMDRA